MCQLCEGKPYNIDKDHLWQLVGDTLKQGHRHFHWGAMLINGEPKTAIVEDEPTFYAETKIRFCPLCGQRVPYKEIEKVPGIF